MSRLSSSKPRGDLYLTLKLFPHPFFRFASDPLVCDVPIRPDEVVLGAQVQVPTPEGLVTMTVPNLASPLRCCLPMAIACVRLSTRRG